MSRPLVLFHRGAVDAPGRRNAAPTMLYMSDGVVCDVCGIVVAPHEHFIVRIDIFADPSIPAVTTEELNEADYASKLAMLMKQMESMSADELQDGVHRRFEYRLCPACQKRYLANPLGLPRGERGPGHN
jgi:hypothetical protein